MPDTMTPNAPASMERIVSSLEARNKLSSAHEAAMTALQKAGKACNDASAKVEAFDAKYPQVMEVVHIEAGKKKQAERGSTGSKVEAEGHAEVPTAKAEGG